MQPTMKLNYSVTGDSAAEMNVNLQDIYFTETPFVLGVYNSQNNSIMSTLDNFTIDNPCGNITEEESEYCVACIIIPILLVSCLIAMFVNIIVIVSVHWVRSPMTPNLKISLSLAAADACSSSTYGLFLLLDEYVPFNLGVVPYIIELFRLSGIVITVVHLLALSMNHYIGIMKPLHYNSIVTSKKVNAVIVLLWVCPTIIVILMCALFDTDGTLLYNVLHNSDIPPKFMDTFAFRITFSSLFFIPKFLMVFCYTHILLVVRKQQNRWGNLSRTESSRYKGRVIANYPNNNKIHKEKKQLEGNVRAVYTTLLILGSCFVGWTPALMLYILTCPIGCYIQGKELIDLNCNYTNVIAGLRLLDNMLVIMKMLANPIIYSIRMKEIKDGTHRMFLAISSLFCPSRRERNYNSYQRSRTQNSTLQVRMTSFKANGNVNHVTVDKQNSNTFL